nr:GFA family protein [Polymorphobacter sp.]
MRQTVEALDVKRFVLLLFHRLGGKVMIKGSCLCSAIQFSLSSPPTMMATCHCSRCRKAGASTFVFVERAMFQWIAGEDFVERHEPPAPYRYVRSFCRRCGSALGEIGSDAASFPLAANLLDDDAGVRPRFHEFVAEKPAWYEICDDAKQFALHPVKGND